MKISIGIGEHTHLRFARTDRSLTKRRALQGLFQIAVILGFAILPIATGLIRSSPSQLFWWLWYGFNGIMLVAAVRQTLKWKKLGSPDASVEGHTTSFSIRPGDSVYVLDGIGPYDVKSFISIKVSTPSVTARLPTRMLARMVDASTGEQTEAHYKIHGGSNEPTEEVFPIPPGTRQALAFWTKHAKNPAQKKYWRIDIQLDAPENTSTWELALSRLAREDAEAFTQKR